MARLPGWEFPATVLFFGISCTDIVRFLTRPTSVGTVPAANVAEFSDLWLLTTC
jgi:hypothetical protein